MPKFSSTTVHPSGNLDAKILSPIVPWVYEDMRGNLWNVIRTEDGWRAGPQKDVYGIKGGTFIMDAFGEPGTTAAAASLVKGIEEHAEAWRIAERDQANAGSQWLLLALLALIVWKDGKR